MMVISDFRSCSDLGLDDGLFLEQWPVELFDELSEFAPAFSEDFIQSYSFDQTQPAVLDFKRAVPESPQVGDNRPLKQLKSTTWNSYEPKSNSDSPPSICTVQSFDSSFMNSPPVEMLKPNETWCSSSCNLTSPPESIVSQSSFGSMNYMANPCEGDKTTSSDDIRLAQAKDHILAERKRRQMLNQRFIALSALLPGLKKMDKASILGDAIKYMKQLQDKVKKLEEQTKKTTMESMVFVNKYEVYTDGDQNESFFSGPIITESLPLIEARFCSKDVLISIQCETRRGVLEKIVAEIEKDHLSVVNSSAMTYGDSALNVTVIAEKDEAFRMSTIELVNNLRSVLKIFK